MGVLSFPIADESCRTLVPFQFEILAIVLQLAGWEDMLVLTKPISALVSWTAAGGGGAGYRSP